MTGAPPSDAVETPPQDGPSSPAATAAGEAGFAARIVQWQKRHGRHGLPWQGTRDPYRVWLSEIMLQQTQVGTVRGYFARFLERFPDVRALAAAPLDDVLALWSGLGYYSRARNLHCCARQVVARHGGEFPRSAGLLQTLPGIGRSTASAIAAFCFGERAAILDGNVKRVLTRVLGYGGDLTVAAHERALWYEATRLLPTARLRETMPRYTQGLMDLGATVCLARNPSCLLCPARECCAARREGAPQNYPVKSKKLKRGAASFWLLQAETPQRAVWLARRPIPGVWAGLYCLPLFDSREALEAAVPARQRARLQDDAAFTHALTHKDLRLHPVRLALPAALGLTLEGAWFSAEQWPRLGLPAPARRLLEGPGTR